MVPHLTILGSSMPKGVNKMFKAIKDNKIIAINETGDFPCLVYDTTEEDTEHTVQDYIQVNGEFVLTSSAEAIEQRKKEVRAVRNQYLEQTDKYLSVSDFPIDEETKEQYRLYRQYLRDYTKQEDWYEQSPLTFEEFKQGSDLEQIVAGGD